MEGRTRTRNSQSGVNVITWTWVYPSNPKADGNYAGAGDVTSILQSSISDCPGGSYVDDGVIRYPNKPCFHSRRYVRTATVLRSVEHTPANPLSRYRASGTFDAKELQFSIPPPAIEYPIDWDAAMVSLVRDATGVVAPEGNILVSLAEIASLKSLARDLLLKLPKFLAALGKSEVKILSSMSAKQLTGNHLAIEFGLLPLLSDIRMVMNCRAIVLNHMKYLIGRPQRVRLRAKAPAIIGQDTSTSSCFRGTWRMDGHVDAKYIILGNVSATCVSKVASPEIQQYAKIAAAYLGANNPIAVLWELVPFSFVVDWFLPIGKNIQQLQMFDGFVSPVREVHLSDFMYSTKMQLEYDTYIDSETPPSSWPGTAKTEGKLKGEIYTSYTRSSGIPGGGFSAPSGWDMHRSALSISLIAQQAMKRKR